MGGLAVQAEVPSTTLRADFRLGERTGTVYLPSLEKSEGRGTRRIVVPIMKSLLVTTVLLLSLCSCNMTPKPKPEAASFRTPSATELFDLQSKCTAMGKKIMEDNIIGNALTQEQVSHYNPKDNRCYVKLTVSTADLTTPRDKYRQDDYLEDGQTNEMLASVTHNGDSKSAMVFDSSLQKLMHDKNQSSTDFDAVSDLMDSFVTTERKP